MTRVALVGAAGRMGQALARCLHEQRVEGLALAAAVDHPDCAQQGADIGALAGIGDRNIAITADLEAATSASDVFIDFSFHAATAAHAQQASGWGQPLVIGTTGLTHEEQEQVREAAEKIPVVMAPNMSLGVNLLFGLAREAARTLKGKGYDVEIVERHHRRKKDAPSGTAIGLGEAVAEGLDAQLDDVAVHGRHGMTGERTSQEIGFHAVRGGDIVGDHTVMFATDGEVLELSHRATSRDAFAVGALRAAAWVVAQPPGLYHMQDVLGL